MMLRCVAMLRLLLTTVAQPIYELGKQAADLMIERLATPTSPYVKRVLPVKLEIRGSVKVKN